jgi:hypothetical protein
MCNVCYIVDGYLFCDHALRYVHSYTYCILCTVLFARYSPVYIWRAAVITIIWKLLVLFHIATMFSYPKLVWRIRLTRDISIRVSLLDTIVGVWVWLLCLQ